MNKLIMACLITLGLAACGESAKDEVTPPDGKDETKKEAKKATPVPMNEAANKGLSVPPPAPAISGTYRSARGQLNIRPTTTPSVYRFWIDMEKKNSCSGSMNGFLTLSDSTHAEFSVEGCDLKFVFQPQQVQVTESGTTCTDYHSASCGFSSIYVQRLANLVPAPAADVAPAESTDTPLSGRYQQWLSSTDGKQCQGWMLELSGTASKPAARGIWYGGNCQAQATAATDVKYEASSHSLTLVLKDEQGKDHRFSGTLDGLQLFNGHWE